MSRPDRVYECYYVALCNFDSNDKHLNIKKENIWEPQTSASAAVKFLNFTVVYWNYVFAALNSTIHAIEIFYQQLRIMETLN